LALKNQLTAAVSQIIPK